jgi:hypothetical protein
LGVCSKLLSLKAFVGPTPVMAHPVANVGIPNAFHYRTVAMDSEVGKLEGLTFDTSG